jgi:hypothetical protein
LPNNLLDNSSTNSLHQFLSREDQLLSQDQLPNRGDRSPSQDQLPSNLANFLLQELLLKQDQPLNKDDLLLSKDDLLHSQ